MRVTTVQWDTRRHAQLWPLVAAQRADLLVLPELSFGPWLPDSRQVDAAAWTASVAEHDAAIARLSQLGASVVVGSRPVVHEGRRYNEAFVWSAGELLGAAHRKTYLPNEEGYWEASWYERGPTSFEPVDTPVGRVGVMLCTEMWFFEHARSLGGSGTDVLAVPRATPSTSVAKWIAGGTAAAVVSGAFCVSANHSGQYRSAAMGGGGWVVEPEEGRLLGRTDQSRPVATVEIDLRTARNAKRTYPRYVGHDPIEPTRG